MNLKMFVLQGHNRFGYLGEKVIESVFAAEVKLTLLLHWDRFRYGFNMDSSFPSLLLSIRGTLRHL